MNRKISVIAILSLTVIFIGCSESTSDLDASQAQFDLSEATYFNEFVACSIGSEHTPEMMNAMISEWSELIDSDALVGAWIYLPASEDNTYPKNGWWELQWGSQDSAESAWEAWLNNNQVSSWTEKYASVLNCDGPNRNAFEGVFPIGTEEFGKFSDSGYFYSEVMLCNYVNGATSKNAKAFLESYSGAVRASEYEGTGYHFGNYYASNNPDADFLWSEFTNSADSYAKVVELFARDVEPTQFPIFSAFASCNENTDKYDGWTVFERAKPSSKVDFLRKS